MSLAICTTRQPGRCFAGIADEGIQIGFTSPRLRANGELGCSYYGLRRRELRSCTAFCQDPPHGRVLHGIRPSSLKSGDSRIDWLATLNVQPSRDVFHRPAVSVLVYSQSIVPVSIIRGSTLPEAMEILAVMLLGDSLKIIGRGLETGLTHTPC